jgi:hypothetical protein
MMMSNVAPANAIATATHANTASESRGSAMPKAATATITRAPVSHSQLRRWPKRPSSGRRTWSMTGAQRNFRL